ncbi:MAG: hypothetical protein GY804_04035 [Alphaproteobacteria bacterium]|nr:hypothetical protein [Alphaproteobacteria bacterium]
MGQMERDLHDALKDVEKLNALNSTMKNIIVTIGACDNDVFNNLSMYFKLATFEKRLSHIQTEFYG